MQEFADGDVNVGLNQTQVVARSVAPTVSPYCSANVCVAPLPEDGVAVSAVTRVSAGAGTVHVPRVCHVLLTPAALAAYVNTLFVPLNAGVKVTGRLTVCVLPVVT